MKNSLMLLVACGVLGAGMFSSPLIAAESIAENLTQITARNRPTIRYARRASVKSGLLFSVGKSELTSFDVVESLNALGYMGVSGGKEEAEIGWSLGYRKAFKSRWSIDTQYVRQNVNSSPIAVTVTAGTEAAAAQDISDNLPKFAQGVSVVGLHHAPITRRLRTHFGGGAFAWRGKRETTVGTAVATDKDSGIDGMLQVGFGFQVTSKLAIEGNIQHFFMPDEAINRASLGMVVSFR